MANTVNIVSQTVELTEVSDVQVTAVEYDAIENDYVREIRILGEVGAGGSAPEVFVLRLRSTSQITLRVASPASEF